MKKKLWIISLILCNLLTSLYFDWWCFDCLDYCYYWNRFKKVKKYKEIICLKKISYLLLLLFELTLLTILAAMVEVKEIVARNCQTLKDDLLFLGGISGHFGSFSYPIGIYFTFLSKKLWTIDGSSNTIQSHFISNCSDPPCTVTPLKYYCESCFQCSNNVLT